MRSNKQRRAGGFAAARYRHRRKLWLRRVWWAFPLIFVLPLVAEGLIILALHARASDLLWGIGLGAPLGAIMVIAESPPSYIDRWRIGAEGEAATARAVRPLLRRGWTLVNDIETEFGNIDHILVGPAGVFVLETKKLNGILAVKRGRLAVRWHEAPDDGYENGSVARRTRGAAHQVHQALCDRDIDMWIQPLVVLWGDFPQGSIQSDNVAWVSGRRLREVLRRRQVVLSPADVSEVSSAVRADFGE